MSALKKPFFSISGEFIYEMKRGLKSSCLDGKGFDENGRRRGRRLIGKRARHLLESEKKWFSTIFETNFC